MERVLTAKGAATRQRIVEAAAALIRERGVADTGLDDIGAATATSKSQLFHYFPGGKLDLLHAVAVHEAEQVIADQQPYLGDLTSWRKWEAWRLRVIEKYAAQGDRCPLSALTSHSARRRPRRLRSSATSTTRGSSTWRQASRRSRTPASSTRTSTLRRPRSLSLRLVQGGVVMMLATNRISYLATALDEALDAMRRHPPTPKAKLPAKAAPNRP